MAAQAPSDKLLGDLAVEKGGISPRASLPRPCGISKTPGFRDENSASDRCWSKKRFITVEQFVELLKLQDKYILQCNSCNAKYNVFGKPEGKRFRCKRCHQILTIATDIKSVSIMDQLTPQTPYGPPQGDTHLLQQLGIVAGAGLPQFQRMEPGTAPPAPARDIFLELLMGGLIRWIYITRQEAAIGKDHLCDRA